ncbi:MAG TPA: ZPR1 zinc finger domain-containing protein [Candidatus Bathyarchaeia archaeon]|nr:ZPR1 zinc finger domain-containing protein [Candidatus Bathyarchaeia archaeon]HKM78556.1 ZPR1 zinc finger domain-containing protein [Candidatus Bathyarchaeia archaeon]
MSSPTILCLRCSNCDSEGLVTNDTEYNVDNFGSVLLNVTSCPHCGYKHTDVLTLTNREPLSLRARISSIEDLDIKVIKSGTATITIPEFKATITPGPYSEGYITNVEGVLEKIEDALTFMLSSADGERLRKGKRMLKQIRNARERKPKFTLTIKDPLGNSALVAANQSKISKRKLTKKELLRIKFGQYADHMN